MKPRVVTALMVVMCLLAPTMIVGDNNAEGSSLFAPLNAVRNTAIDISYTSGFGLEYSATAGQNGAHPFNRVIIRNTNDHVFQSIRIDIQPWIMKWGRLDWVKNPVPVHRNIYIRIYDNDGLLIKTVIPPSNTGLFPGPIPLGESIDLNMTLGIGEAIQVEPVIIKVPMVKGTFSSDITVVGEYVEVAGGAPAYVRAPSFSTLEVLGFPEVTLGTTDGIGQLQASDLYGMTTNSLTVTNTGTEPIDSVIFSLSNLVGNENVSHVIDPEGFSVTQYPGFVGSYSSARSRWNYDLTDYTTSANFADIFAMGEVPDGTVISVRGGLFYMNDTSLVCFHALNSSWGRASDIAYSNGFIVVPMRSDNPTHPSDLDFSVRSWILVFTYPDLELYASIPIDYGYEGQFNAIADVEVLPDGNFLIAGAPNLMYLLSKDDPTYIEDVSYMVTEYVGYGQPNGIQGVDVHVNDTGVWQMVAVGGGGFVIKTRPPFPWPPIDPPFPPRDGGGVLLSAPQYSPEVFGSDGAWTRTWSNASHIQTGEWEDDYDPGFVHKNIADVTGFNSMVINDDASQALITTMFEGVYVWNISADTLEPLIPPTIANLTGWALHGGVGMDELSVSPVVTYNHATDEWMAVGFNSYYIYDGTTLDEYSHNISFIKPYLAIYGGTPQNILGGVYWQGLYSNPYIYGEGLFVQLDMPTGNLRYIFLASPVVKTYTTTDQAYTYVVTWNYIHRLDLASGDFTFYPVPAPVVDCVITDDYIIISDMENTITQICIDFSCHRTLYKNSDTYSVVKELVLVNDTLYFLLWSNITDYLDVGRWQRVNDDGVLIYITEVPAPYYDYWDLVFHNFFDPIDDRYLIFQNHSAWNIYENPYGILDFETGEIVWFSPYAIFGEGNITNWEPEWVWNPDMTLEITSMFYDNRTDLLWWQTWQMILAFDWSEFKNGGDISDSLVYIQETQSNQSDYINSTFHWFGSGHCHFAKDTGEGDYVFLTGEFETVLRLNASSPTNYEDLISESLIYINGMDTHVWTDRQSVIIANQEGPNLFLVTAQGDYMALNIDTREMEYLGGSIYLQDSSLTIGRIIADGDDDNVDGYATVLYEEGNSPFTIQYLFEPIPPGATRYFSFTLPDFGALDQSYAGMLTVYTFSNGTPAIPTTIPFTLFVGTVPTLTPSVDFTGNINYLLFDESILEEDDVVSLNSFVINNQGSGKSISSGWIQFDDLTPDAPPPTIEDTIPVKSNADLVLYPFDTLPSSIYETTDGSPPIVNPFAMIREKCGQSFVATTDALSAVSIQYKPLLTGSVVWFELFEYVDAPFDPFNPDERYVNDQGIALSEMTVVDENGWAYAEFTTPVELDIGEKYVMFPMKTQGVHPNGTARTSLYLYDTEPYRPADPDYSVVISDTSSWGILSETTAYTTYMKLYTEMSNITIPVDANGVASLNATLAQYPVLTNGYIGEFKLLVHNTSLGSETVHPAPFSYMGPFTINIVSGDDGSVGAYSYGSAWWTPYSTLSLMSPDYNRMIDGDNASWNVLVDMNWAELDPYLDPFENPEMNNTAFFSVESELDIDYTLSVYNKTLYTFGDDENNTVWVHVDVQFNEPVFDEASVQFVAETNWTLDGGLPDSNDLELVASNGIYYGVQSKVVTMNPDTPFSLFTARDEIRFGNLYAGTEAIEPFEILNTHVIPVTDIFFEFGTLYGSAGTNLSEYDISVMTQAGMPYGSTDQVLHITDGEILPIGALTSLRFTVMQAVGGYDPNQTYDGIVDIYIFDAIGQCFVIRGYPIVVDGNEYLEGYSPVALIQGDRDLLASVNETLVFVSGSTTPIGYILNYTWDFGDGTYGYGAVETHNYSMPGFYEVTLTVMNSYGMVSSDAINVTVTTTGTLPSLEMTTPPEYDITLGYADDLVLTYSFIVHNAPQAVITVAQLENSSAYGAPFNVTFYDASGNVLFSTDVYGDAVDYLLLSDPGEITMVITIANEDIPIGTSDIWFSVSVSDNDGNLGEEVLLHASVERGVSVASMWMFIGAGMVILFLVLLVAYVVHVNSARVEQRNIQDAMNERRVPGGAVSGNRRNRRW